jgi:predicted DNA-binding helix-hairpin-helix protein
VFGLSRIFALSSSVLVYTEIAAKLEILANAAKYDASCASGGAIRKTAPGGIGNSTLNGDLSQLNAQLAASVSLLKILLTNHVSMTASFA